MKTSILYIVTLGLAAQRSLVLAEPDFPDQPARIALPAVPVEPVPAAPVAVPEPPALPAAPELKGKGRVKLAKAAAEPLDPELFAVDEKIDDVWRKTDLMLSRTGSKGGRNLIIPSSTPDPTALTSANEDLAVMARVLQKAVAQASADSDRKKAMGIELRALPGSSSSFRNLYLEGYGAIFVLNVRFPLLPAPEKKEPPSSKETTSTEWDEAWKETFGGGGADTDVERVFRNVAGGATMEYDAQKVEDLKTGLLEALKNATHIRSLKPEEMITLMVLGAEGRSERVVAKVSPEAGAQGGVFYRAGAGVATADGRKGAGARGESALMMRVKKSAVDAFAKGNLNLEEFRKKAAVLAYLTGDRMSPASASRP
jgi:hypothetical protein